jgi:hypothetical protein
MKFNATCQYIKKGLIRRGVYALLGVFALGLLAGCLNPLQTPEPGDIAPVDIRTGDGLVHLSIGEESVEARTIQPETNALAGYRLTFSGGPSHEPVDFTGNHVDIYLADGSYIITATAYWAGGTVGDAAHEAASGAISVTLSGGLVTSNGGIVPPIILGPAGTADGTLVYTITSTTAASGTMKLWEIDGITPVGGFGTSGVLDTGASPSISDDTFTLAAGRYVTEIRLVDGAGNVAVLREVVEIWAGTTTVIVFAPEAAGYLDPNALPANSGANLSAASTIGGTAIGTGNGSGVSEDDPVSYTLAVTNINNAPQSFVLEAPGSLFAALSWAATTGSAPGSYGTTAIPNFSTNNVLWVKVISEDTSTEKFYRFTLIESDLIVSGTGAYTYSGDAALRVLTITGNGTYTIGMKTGVTTTTKARIVVASGVTADITLSDVDINMSGKANTPAFDMTGATVNLTLTGTNVFTSGSNRAGLQAPDGSTLVITAASTGNLVSTGGSVGAGIGGGSDSKGGNVTISGGHVTATGTAGTAGNSHSAGIGGGGGTASNMASYIGGGTVTITGGTVIASGGRGIGAGHCPGGRVGEGGSFTITGGIVHATGIGSQGGPAGLGGGTFTIQGGVIYAGLIGGGVTNTGTFTEISNAVVFMSSGGASLPAGNNLTNSLVFIGAAGTLYGNVVLGFDTEISSPCTLDISPAQTLTVSTDKTLTNKGIINNNGTIINNGTIDNQGTINNRGVISGSVGGTPVNNLAPERYPVTGFFTDTDPDGNQIGGTISWETPSSTLGIQGYHVYWGQSETEKLAGDDGVKYTANGGTAVSCTVSADTALPSGAAYFLIYSYNQSGDSEDCLAIPIWDSGTLNGTYGAFTVSGTGNASYSAPLLTIANGTYTISGTSTTDCIAVALGATSLNVTFDGLNIDVSSVTDACAFDMTGAAVDLTLTGPNVLKSGVNKAGILAPSGSTLVIKTAGTGSLNATGKDYGAGIGGGYSQTGGTITIESGTVTATGGKSGAGIGGGGGYDIHGGAGGTITISGGEVIAQGGTNAAGIGGGSGTSSGAGGTITISGGEVIAQGGSLGGAGIGGGGGSVNGGAGGNITISGGEVIATGSYGAGIGGGHGGAGGNIAITGGAITATSSYGAGIGGGSGGGAGTITELSGNVVVFASSIQPTLTAGVNAALAIAFNGNAGTMYGDVTLQQDVTIPSSRTLTIPSGNTLTIPGGVTLTNNGTIHNRGTISGNVGGTVINLGPSQYPATGSFVDTDPDAAQIGGTIGWQAPSSNAGIQGYHVYWGQSETEKLAGDDGVKYTANGGTAESCTVPADTVLPSGAAYFLIYSYNQNADSDNCLAVPIVDSGPLNGTYGAFTVSGTGNVSYSAPLLTITNGNYTISGTSTADRIVVAPGTISANVTFNGLNINVSSVSEACAFDMSDSAVNLTLTGSNVLKSGQNKAGIHTTSGSILVITVASTGSLNVTGGSSGAGIGGKVGSALGAITIDGGTITAIGGSGGAGIGGGGGGYSKGTITINGGEVTATGNGNAAGIGGGTQGPGGTITINGGTVVATGSVSGAGIGGGGSVSNYSGGGGGTISIKGGTVTATGGAAGAGIGGGSAFEGPGGGGGTISIEGGTVTATGGGDAADIGGGSSLFGNGGAGGTVTIKGGMVTATASSGVGIGGGRSTSGEGSNGAAGTITALSGNAVVFASSIQPTLTAGDNATQAIVFNNNAGTMYGDVTLQQDVTIPSGKTLGFLNSSQILTIPGAVTLTNNGIINKNGGTIVGTVGGSGTVNP